MIATASTSRTRDGASSSPQFACGCATCSAGSDWLQPVEAVVVETAAVSPTDDGDGTVTVGGSYEGAVNTEGDTDIITVTLEAGETYMISLRGTGPDALLDPFLQISDPNDVAVGTDDDGGTYINSMMTITATVAGTYQITAGALPATGGIGTYTVDVRQMEEDSVPGDLTSTTTLTMNANTFGFIEESGEFDVYQIQMVAGRLYAFEVAGGADYNTHYLAVPPGELDTKLTLFDAEGNEVAFNDDINFSPVPGNGDLSSALGFTAAETGTYYLRVEAYESDAGGGTGGYALTAEEVDISGLDPLDSIDWGGVDNKTPSNEITVYFVPETDPSLYDGVKSLGWTPYEIQQAMAAFETYSDIADVTFTQVFTPEEATFKLLTSVSDSFLGYFWPPGEENAGVGVFAINWPSWDRTGDTGALEQGADGWFTLIHEFGHGLGLAHPHDQGGGSEVMAGVTSPFDSYGVFDLNQGIYTTMSYNPGWQKHPDSTDGSPDGATTWGLNGGPGAFDVAKIQQKYGANPDANAGNTTYILPDTNKEGTFYLTIWDVSGIDTILHDGTVSAQIDLTAATLDYSPTGAGVVSFVGGIFGGFTIANGAVIENATGGSGADVLIGNSAANVLDGRGGADKMIGGAGDDTYVVDEAEDIITESETGGIDRVKSSITYSLAGQNLENLTLIGTAAINGTGNDLANHIAGNSAANILDGGSNADTMAGDAGDDTYIVDDIGDRAIETADQGIDLVRSSVDHTLGAHVENLALTGTAVAGTGNSQNNMITGTVAANVLSGENGADTLLGSAGKDTLFGGANNDSLNGGVASDILYGGVASDSLEGGAGHDRLHGESGNDTMSGGDGHDIFYFDAPFSLSSNVDRILDFTIGDDRMALDRSVFTGIAANGKLAAGAFHVGGAAADAGDRIIYDAATGQLFYDADGIGGVDQILFARVEPALALTHADFVGYI